MLGLLLERLAEAFGLTRRTRPLTMLLVFGVSLALVALMFAEGGPNGLFALALLLALPAVAAWQVLSARSALWRAATRGLDHPGEGAASADHPPTARALRLLARAVDEARRGRLAEAERALVDVDRARLRDEELRLLAATHAMVAFDRGDAPAAAEQADRALPTQSEDIDAQLGRAVVADAWGDADRLRALDDAWAARGVEQGSLRPLPRLRALVRLRIDTSAIETLTAADAKALADEARAIGDESLAADLEARGRASAYR